MNTATVTESPHFRCAYGALQQLFRVCIKGITLLYLNSQTLIVNKVNKVNIILKRAIINNN
jgi:hypothetical protein